MIPKVRKYYHTIKYFSVVQIIWLVLKIIKLKPLFIRFSNFGSKKYDVVNNLVLSNFHLVDNNLYSSDNEFTFLNKIKKFNKIDWDFNDYGMLWLYNLNYFDYLLQNDINKDEGIRLIHDFIEANSLYGYDPYPLSLRIVNWIKFIVKNKVSDQKILNSLFSQVQNLKRNIEFHLQANHLFENGIALLWSAYFFNDEKIYRKANKIINKQLNKQILRDGAHYELSPMYHQIILTRLLNIIDLSEHNKYFNNLNELKLFKSKASQMCSWLQSLTYNSGKIPLVNDSTDNIALSTKELFKYANKLNISFKSVNSDTSGYRMVKFDNYEVLVDVGSICSNEQPGHTHSDIFNFELIVNNQPVIVDTGISTYEKNERRQIERSIISHNTVQIDKLEPIEVWGGFRVGKRANIKIIEDTQFKITAQHNGFKSKGIIHQRSFSFNQKKIEISDNILGNKEKTAKAYFHFSNKIELEIVNESCINTEYVKIEFENCISITKSEYKQALGFNKLVESIKITVFFKEYLKTKVHLN